MLITGILTKRRALRILDRIRFVKFGLQAVSKRHNRSLVVAWRRHVPQNQSILGQILRHLKGALSSILDQASLVLALVHAPLPSLKRAYHGQSFQLLPALELCQASCHVGSILLLQGVVFLGSWLI